MQLLLWSLISYGIVQIIVDMTFFDWLKNLFDRYLLTDWISDMMNCKICCGVWTGMVLSIGFFSPTLQYFPYSNFYGSIFLDGMLCSCVVWFVNLLENKLN